MIWVGIETKQLKSTSFECLAISGVLFQNFGKDRLAKVYGG
jgi:hypothetical protein